MQQLCSLHLSKTHQSLMEEVILVVWEEKGGEAWCIYYTTENMVTVQGFDQSTPAQ